MLPFTLSNCSCHTKIHASMQWLHFPFYSRDNSMPKLARYISKIYLSSKEAKNCTSNWLEEAFFSCPSLTQVRVAGRLLLVDVNRLIWVNLRGNLVYLLRIPSSIFPNQLGHSHWGGDDGIGGYGGWGCRWVWRSSGGLHIGLIFPLAKLTESLVDKASLMRLVAKVVSKRLLHLTPVLLFYQLRCCLLSRNQVDWNENRSHLKKIESWTQPWNSNLRESVQECCLHGCRAVEGDWPECGRQEEFVCATLHLPERTRLPEWNCVLLCFPGTK